MKRKRGEKANMSLIMKDNPLSARKSGRGPNADVRVLRRRGGSSMSMTCITDDKILL